MEIGSITAYLCMDKLKHTMTLNKGVLYIDIQIEELLDTDTIVTRTIDPITDCVTCCVAGSGVITKAITIRRHDNMTQQGGRNTNTRR